MDNQGVLPRQPAMTAVIAARLDRLPIFSWHRRAFLILAAALGMGLYDVFMASYVTAATVRSGFMTTGQEPYFIGSVFVGGFVGVVVIGWLGDRFGRRSMFIASLLVYGILTIAMAFSPSAEVLIVLRFLGGVGIGTEFVIVDTYIGEIIPRRWRGRFMMYTWTIGNTAFPVVAFLALWLVPLTPLGLAGWRWLFLIGGAGSIVIWFVRLGLSESPRWLEAHGHEDQADALVTQLEARAERETGRPLPPPEEVDETVVAAERVPLRDVLRRPYSGRVALMIGLYVCAGIGYFGFASWAPTLLVKEGFTFIHAVLYSAIAVVAAPIGTLVGSLFAERFERRWTLSALAVGLAVAGLVFGFGRNAVVIVVASTVLALLNNWLSPVIHTFQVEFFPTRIRATAGGFVYGWSRLSSAFSAVVVAFFLDLGGVPAVFIAITVCMLLIPLLMGIFGRNTNLMALEQISP